MASFMLASETKLIVLAVDGNVVHMLLRELLNGIFDGLNTTLLAHGLGRIVRVASRTVPVTLLEWLGMERYLDTPLFGYTNEEEAGHPEVVTHRDTLAGTNLELPLRRHDLGIDTRYINTGVEACAVVSLDQITSEDFASALRQAGETRGWRTERRGILRTNTTIIGTLGAWEASLGPTEWLVIRIKEGVLLLETEPGLVLLDGVHHLLGMMTVVSPVGSTVVVVGLGEDEDVIATTEGIPEDGGWAKVDIGIVARCLIR